MSQPWERLPEETPRAYECFKAFLEAGPSREVKAVYRRVVGKPEARAVPGVWNGWIARYQWQDRARAYDAECDRKAHEETIKSKQLEHAAKLEQYRKAHEQSGIGGLEIVLHGKRLLANFIKSNPEVTNLKEAESLGRIIQMIDRPSSEAWADALGIRTLLEQLDVMQDI